MALPDISDLSKGELRELVLIVLTELEDRVRHETRLELRQQVVQAIGNLTVAPSLTMAEAPPDGTPIEELALSVRARNRLLREGIRTIGDLRAKSVAELREYRHIGPATIDEIVLKLEYKGIGLKDE